MNPESPDSERINYALRQAEAAGQTPRAGGDSPGQTAASWPSGQIPGYQFLRELHRGGQGVVFLAVQQSTGRKVAIKTLREGALAGSAERARFEREVRILAQLRHPHIVSIHDSGRAGGVDYFVMDYIPGLALDEHVAHFIPSRLDAILRLFAAVCDAVDSAHQRGVIHRDLKPANIRVDSDGQPHVLDFGLARMLMPSAQDAAAMTQTGHFMGSLPWVSPEQAEGMYELANARSDVYSLGIVLYQLLTRRFPYDVNTPLHKAVQTIVTAEPSRPRSIAPEIPEEVETIILKCLRKTPDERYFSAGELARDVRRYLAGEPIVARGESGWYRSRVRTRLFLARRPLTLAVMVVAASVLVSIATSPWILRALHPVNAMYGRLPGLLLKSRSGIDEFRNVRMIVMKSRPRMKILADELGVKGVDLPDDWPGMRRLHGLLMEKLAAAGPCVVAWDISFADTKPSPFDTDLARGAEALLAAGGDVVIRTVNWQLRPDGRPTVIDALLDVGVKCGSTMGTFDGAPWQIEYVMQAPQTDARPSLALAACAAAALPGAAVSIRFRPEGGMVDVLRAEAQSRRHRRVETHVSLPSFYLSGSSASDAPREDLERGAVVGSILVTLPVDDVFERATLDYDEAMRLPPQRLREWVGSRIVLVGDATPEGQDFHEYEGRSLPGVYAHAASIEAIRGGSMIRLATMIDSGGLAAALAIGGIFVARRWDRRKWHLIAAVVLCGIVMVIAALATTALSRFVFHPIFPWTAFAVAVGLTTWSRRALRLPGAHG